MRLIEKPCLSISADKDDSGAHAISIKSGLPDTWLNNPRVGANIIAPITAAFVAKRLAKFGVTMFFLLCWLILPSQRLNIGDWSSFSPCLSRGTFNSTSWFASSGSKAKAVEPTSWLELQTSESLESPTQQRSRTCGEEPEASRISVAPTWCNCRVACEWNTSSCWPLVWTSFAGKIPSCKDCWSSGSCLRVLPETWPNSASILSTTVLPISPWLIVIIRPLKSFKARQSPCHDLLLPWMSWCSSHRPGLLPLPSRSSPSVWNIPSRTWLMTSDPSWWSPPTHPQSVASPDESPPALACSSAWALSLLSGMDLPSPPGPKPRASSYTPGTSWSMKGLLECPSGAFFLWSPWPSHWPWPLSLSVDLASSPTRSVPTEWCSALGPLLSFARDRSSWSHSSCDTRNGGTPTKLHVGWTSPWVPCDLPSMAIPHVWGRPLRLIPTLDLPLPPASIVPWVPQRMRLRRSSTWWAKCCKFIVSSTTLFKTPMKWTLSGM